MNIDEETGDPLDNQVRLAALLGMVGEPPNEPPNLESLEKEARGYGKRRADRQGSRDNLIYRAGYAIDAAGGLGIEPEVFAALLTSSWLMFEVASLSQMDSTNDEFFADLANLLERNPEVVVWARQVGRCLCWDRLNALYQEETEIFRESAAFADSEARWRTKAMTANQRYLVGEICRLTGQAVPENIKRGAAFDFIELNGGNPRFWTRPTIDERPEFRR